MTRRNAAPAALSEELLRDLTEIEYRIQASTGHRRSGDFGHVYVIRFTTGVVKVGKAVNPPGRIAQHATQARVHGVDIAESWASQRHPDHSQTETRLIDYCADHGERIAAGKEYFTGLSFEAVRDAAQRLIDAVGGDLSKTWAEADAAAGPAAA